MGWKIIIILLTLWTIGYMGYIGYRTGDFIHTLILFTLVFFVVKMLLNYVTKENCLLIRIFTKRKL
jgi:hypothetical protein